MAKGRNPIEVRFVKNKIKKEKKVENNKKVRKRSVQNPKSSVIHVCAKKHVFFFYVFYVVSGASNSEILSLFESES